MALLNCWRDVIFPVNSPLQPGEFFKSDDYYIALGSEKFTTADLKEIINELYPNGQWPKHIFKSWENQRSRKRKPHANEYNATNSQNQAQSQTTQQSNAVSEIYSNKRVPPASLDESTSDKTVAKMSKTGKSGSENVAQPASSNAAPVVSDSRTRVEGERMKKDSGFVEEMFNKESNSPSHQHTAAQSAAASQDQTVSQQERSPRDANQELPTVFEVKSTDSSQQASINQNASEPKPKPDRTLRPVQPKKVLPPPEPQHEVPQSQNIAPSAVASNNAPKTTKEVDEQLANVLEQQQMTHANVGSKYSVLPEIGKSKEVKEEPVAMEEDDQKVPVVSEAKDNEPMETQAAAKPIEESPPSKSIPVKESVTLEGEPAASTPQKSQTPRIDKIISTTPSKITTKKTDENKNDSQLTTSRDKSEKKIESSKPVSQQASKRPKLEHQAVIIDGKPDSRPTSRSSSIPNSAPGRVVNGKLSRQISKIDYITTRFEYVGKQLGDGNFAVVRRCKRRKTGAEFAMKVIDKSKLKGKFHMVENEIRIMRACDHENLVKLYEMYETDREIFLVMELVPDGDLFDTITAAVKFDEPTASKMVHDMASGLFYLHSRKIVHRFVLCLFIFFKLYNTSFFRDLKPENLLVLRSSKGITLKLGDFGLAMEVTEPIFSVCGTPTYVAPEILAEKGKVALNFLYFLSFFG